MPARYIALLKVHPETSTAIMSSHTQQDHPVMFINLLSHMQMFHQEPMSLVHQLQQIWPKGLNLSPREELDLLCKWLGPKSSEHAKRITSTMQQQVSICYGKGWKIVMGHLKQ
ncbi:hypothetical protein NQZ68_015948 [Dissostichus eleginoides]|nr:hypothetical protein NQZ68_015948 [Dissostichus eleginoides]